MFENSTQNDAGKLNSQMPQYISQLDRSNDLIL